MQRCNTCATTETSKWYSCKTECRKCYRKRNYIKVEKSQTKKACYTSLQPLWAEDNLSKGARYAS